MMWVKSKLLGRGSYGTVSLANPIPGFSNSHHLPSVLAVKSSNIENCSFLIKEGVILEELRGCSQIVSCFGDDMSVEDGEKVYNLLLEYAPGGTLSGIIDIWGGCLPESEVSMYAYMLLTALDHIHGKGYVHCDIKPSNILIFPCTVQGEVEVNLLKIADFGLAKKADIRAGAQRCGLYYVRGTAPYSSPESVVDGQYEWPSDIWSLGCVLIELFTRAPVYWENEDLEKLLRQIATDEDLPEITPFLSKEGRDFLKRCLIRDPRQRWTASRLLNHPFIVDNYKKLPSQHRELLSQEEDSNGCSPWWSGHSLFSTAPMPAPIRSIAPPGFSSNNHAAAAADKLSQLPAQFLPPHQICSKNHAAAAGPLAP